MPTKEYSCMNCDDQPKVERVERINSTELPPLCPSCGNRMVWSPSAMAFSLKGNDWPGKNVHVKRGPRK